MIQRATATALCLLASAPLGAEAISLKLPIDCEIGSTCYIEDYVDNAPETGRQTDFACGINSRDGHRGTDIALLSFDALEQGIDVKAAARGTVLRTRDGMPDDPLMRGVTSQTACGNAVLIRHDGGWQTLYCHLQQGSLTVSEGMTVEADAVLGHVGLSGQTNHPHVHFTVLKDGDVVDPFRPEATGTCGDPVDTLWADPPSYTATGMITAGFSDRVPEFDEIRSGTARLAEGRADAPLVMYTHIGHAEHGDLLTFSASGPGGEIFAREIVLKAPKVSISRSFGKRAPADGWPVGEYLGEATLTRAGQIIAHRFAHVTVSR